MTAMNLEKQSQTAILTAFFFLPFVFISSEIFPTAVFTAIAAAVPRKIPAARPNMVFFFIKIHFVIVVILLFTASDSALWLFKEGYDAEQLGTLIKYKSIVYCFADPIIILFLGGFFLADAATKEYAVSSRNRARLQMLDQYLIEHFHITFGNRIMKQINTYIPVFIACGGEELVALDDILAKKVIRKLETQNPIYLRNSSEGLISFIDELFGADNMSLCKDLIHRLQRNA